MKKIILTVVIVLSILSSCNDSNENGHTTASPDMEIIIEVTNATQLREAFKNAQPGSVINVASGEYHGEFNVEV